MVAESRYAVLVDGEGRAPGASGRRLLWGAAGVAGVACATMVFEILNVWFLRRLETGGVFRSPSLLVPGVVGVVLFALATFAIRAGARAGSPVHRSPALAAMWAGIVVAVALAGSCLTEVVIDVWAIVTAPGSRHFTVEQVTRLTIPSLTLGLLSAFVAAVLAARTQRP